MRVPEKLAGPVRSCIRNVELVEAQFAQGWPSFHDAEISRISLDRSGPSAQFELIVPWRDASFDVELLCEAIDDLELSGFNHQNVLFEMVFSSTGAEASLRMDLHGIYGVTGFVICKFLHVCKVDRRLA